MSNENSNSSSQQAYADSDLVPLSSLFGEMGADRSFWRKVGSGFNRWTSILQGEQWLTGFQNVEDGLFGRNSARSERNRDLQKLGIGSISEYNSETVIELTKVRKSAIDALKDDKYRVHIFEKIFQSGLIDLALKAGGMKEFAKKRFESVEKLRASASEYNDPARDTIWLDKLLQVKNSFIRDPLLLGTVYHFFPNLYKLFAIALASTADYGYSTEDPINNQQAIMDAFFKSFGVDSEGNSLFKPIWASENLSTAQRIEEALRKMATATSTPPASPDVFHLRLGAANFYVPPIAINVNTGFQTGSLTGGAIRQKSSPKYNSGFKQTSINMKLFFPNYEEIWGISIEDAKNINLGSDFIVNFKDSEDEKKIDKFLSSLRGLVAAFKYAPITPVRNHYLNSVFDITGVALSSMNISTVEGYPFVLQVDLELLHFNHKPFLPMIKDFNQAIHWGKYRDYMGKAAGSLANAVSADFLLSASDDESIEPITESATSLDADAQRSGLPADRLQEMADGAIVEPYTDGVLRTNIYSDWTDGKNLTLYIPKQIQSKLYSPDTSMFENSEESVITESGKAFWENLMSRFGINVTNESFYRSLESTVITSLNNSISISQKNKVAKLVDVALAGVNANNVYEQAYSISVQKYISENNIKDPEEKDYLINTKPPSELEAPSLEIKKIKEQLYRNAQSVEGFLRSTVEDNVKAAMKKDKLETDRSKPGWDEKKYQNYLKKEEAKLADAFMGRLYDRVFQDEAVKKLLEKGLASDANRLGLPRYTLKEWEVPMIKVNLDPESVIINSVSVFLRKQSSKNAVADAG